MFRNAPLAGLVFSLALWAGFASPAGADWEEAPPSGWRHFFRDRQVGVAFNSLSVTQWGWTLTSGSKVALFSRRDSSGPRLLTFSTQKLRETDPLVDGRFTQNSSTRVLAGYEWFRDNLVVSLYAGASLAVPAPYEQAVSGVQTRLGMVALLEFWKTWPAGGSLPAGFSAGSLMLDSAERSLFLRFRQGFQTPYFGLSLGPDLSLSLGTRISVGGIVARDAWQKVRAGAHATGFRLGQFGLNLSAGYEWRRGERSGLYTEATMLWYY